MVQLITRCMTCAPRQTTCSSTDHVDKLNQRHSELNSHCVGQVSDWSHQRIVSLTLEQVIEQTDFVLASKTWTTVVKLTFNWGSFLTFLSHFTSSPSDDGALLRKGALWLWIMSQLYEFALFGEKRSNFGASPATNVFGGQWLIKLSNLAKAWSEMRRNPVHLIPVTSSETI